MARKPKIVLIFLIFAIMVNQGCADHKREPPKDPFLVHLVVLDPGHFHAALLQKSANDQVDSNVYVFGPEGPDIRAHLRLIDSYNQRKDAPTHWKENVYAGPDYLEKMLKEKPGNLVVIAGNNRLKTDYIGKSVAAGLNVLADKPMAISPAGFERLKKAFADAEKNKVLLYDIMTERYEITNMLQKALSAYPDIFGELEKGDVRNPAIVSESVHYFFKDVSGIPLVRPAWYFDVDQEGEGIVDVTTHMVDLIQWACFSNVQLDYEKDIRMLAARRWATVLTRSQFRQVTQLDQYPDFLKKEVTDSLLNVYANGEMNYTIRGTHTRVSVVWKFAAPEGSGDSFYSLLRGTKANLVIRQDKEQQYMPTLYIEPTKNADAAAWKKALDNGIDSIGKTYPGVGLVKSGSGWRVVVPEKYHIGHEQHFALVFKKYIEYFRNRRLPDWEKANMLAKYYTTTKALEKAQGK